MKKTTTFLLSTVFLSKTLASKALHRVVRIALFLIIFSCFSSYSIAGIQEKQNIPKMVQRSDLIIRGKVISTESQWKEDSRGRHIYTNVTVKILDKIKGNIKDGAFAFEVIGGTVDDIGEVVSNTPAFEIDEDAIVFLTGVPLAIQPVSNGKILVYDDRVYLDGSEVTVDSVIRALKILEQDPNAPISLGEKYQAPTAEATAVPIITSISSDEAPAGTEVQVTITGTNFGSTQGSSKVEFFYKNRQQKIPASIVSWSNTQIICTVPVGTTSTSSSLVIVTTSDSTGSGYVTAAAECFIYNGYKWSGTSPVVYYKINENTSDCYGEGAAVQRAADTWNNVGSNFRFEYDGSCYSTGSSQNYVNCITWGTVSSGALAETAWWYYVSTNEIFECDIVFDDGYTWSTKPTPYSWEYDVESVALHELGHWLNLGDLYDSADSDKVMYGYISAGEVKRILHQCDIDGICDIYGGDCTQQYPDLYDDGESWRSFSPTMIQGGQNLSISCDVRNGGTAASSSFVVKFYASTNTTISSFDYYIGQKSMSGISAGSWASCDWSGPFPAEIPADVYWVGWIIDADNNVSESNEDNNTAYKEGYQLTIVQTRTLTVTSSNPNSGVSITVSPNDNAGQGSGTTTFTRTYNNATVVTLTAPSTTGSNRFQKWQRDGVDHSTNLTTTVTMNNNYTMMAVYIPFTPPQTQDDSITTSVDTPVMITLQAVDDGYPNPPAALTYIITSLPIYGDLYDPCAGLITDPCTPLVSYGNEVEYTPYTGYEGPDSFTFIANDGSGDSNVATISINVTACTFFDDFPSTTLDANNWTETFGTPTVDGLAGNEPSPPYSLHLEATDAVSSRVIDLYGCWSAQLSYSWKRAGTEPNDNLNVDYWDGNEWKTLDVLTGGANTNWEPNSVELPADALHSEFRVRFWADCDSTDDEWYIDDLCVQRQSCIELPVLHPEPNTTQGTCNTIYWEPTADANEYYAECANDVNFTNIDANSDWITDTNYEFCSLEPNQAYWYHVKAWAPFSSKNWLQTSQVDFETDTLTDTRATADGNVVLADDTGISTVDTVGDSSLNTATTYGYLNCFLVTTETTLTQIEVYLGISTSCSIEFVVYEGGPSFSDSYNRIHSSTLASSGTGTKFYNSGPISVPLEAGKHYMIGASWSSSVVMYCSTGHISPIFGSHVGYGYYNGFPSPNTITNTSSSDYTFYHRYTTIQATGYTSPGSVVSAAIDLPADGNWVVVDFNTTTPADTELTVDILDATDESIIVADISSGTDINEITVTSLKLRANLSTTDSNNTPVLYDWLATYTDPALACESDWSNVEFSKQVSPQCVVVPTVTEWQIAATHGGSVGELWCSVADGYVESRVSGISKLRVCFDQPMDTNVIDPNVISIEAVANGIQPDPCSIVWDSNDCMIITLSSALPDANTYRVTVSSDVKSAAGCAIVEASICLTALKGDVNGNQAVNAQDMLAIKSRAGQSVDCNSARYDVNCSGEINAQDMLAVRPNAGHTAPECPL